MKVKVHPIIVILVILIFAFLIFVTIDNIRTFYNNRKAIIEREKEYEKQRDARIAKEVENFKLILKRNQIMADSIADNYNQEFNYNYNNNIFTKHLIVCCANRKFAIFARIKARRLFLNGKVQ